MDKISIKCDCTDCNGSRQTGKCNFDNFEIAITTPPPTPPPNYPILFTQSKLRKRKNSTDKNEIK